MKDICHQLIENKYQFGNVFLLKNVMSWVTYFALKLIGFSEREHSEHEPLVMLWILHCLPTCHLQDLSVVAVLIRGTPAMWRTKLQNWT